MKLENVKFRAYLKLTKEIVNVEKIDFENKQIYFYKNNSDRYLYVCDFKNIELMSFTGFYDKNGKEIYENDIINMHYFFDNHDPVSLGVYEDEDEFVGVVKHDLLDGFHIYDIENDSRAYFQWVQDPSEELEVIGNIFNNPELLGDR